MFAPEPAHHTSKMSFQNTGRYVRSDPDLDTFEEEQIRTLSILKEWGSSEMRLALLAAEDPPADPHEAFKRLGRLYRACQDNARLKLSSDWSYQEKYKKVAMDYMEAGFYDSLNKEGNWPAIIEACRAARAQRK